jgi:mono/diheme cytochrome c family protein
MSGKVRFGVGRKARFMWLSVLVVGLGGCSPMDDALAYWFGRHMRDSRSFDPYENTIAPPENSVAFASGNNTSRPGRLNTGQPEPGVMPAAFTQADLFTPLVQDMPNPVPANQASLERGEVLFNRVCAVCHGPTGVGSGANIIEKFPLLAGYDISGPQSSAYTDGFIYGKIRVGGPIMPAYGHQISHFDRWNIVNYLRVLQRQAGNTPAGAQ